MTESELLLNEVSQKGEDENDKDLQQRQDYAQILKGILAAALWSLAVAISEICVQALKGKIPHMQLNTMRFAFPACGLILYFIIKRDYPTIDRSKIGLVTISFYIFSSNVVTLSTYVSVVYIPLATYESLFITSNIISTFLIFGILWRLKKEWNQVRNNNCYHQWR